MTDENLAYFEKYNGIDPIEALQKLSEISADGLKARAYEALIRNHILNGISSLMEVPENHFSAELLEKIEVLRTKIAKLQSELDGLDSATEEEIKKITGNPVYAAQKEAHKNWIERRNALLDLKQEFEKKESLEKKLEELRENLSLASRLPEVIKLQEEIERLRKESLESPERVDLITKRNAAERQLKAADEKYSLKSSLFKKSQAEFFTISGMTFLNDMEVEDAIKVHDEVIQGVVAALGKAEVGSKEANKLIS